MILGYFNNTFLVIYIHIANSMEQSPWKANNESANQEIPPRFIIVFTAAHHWSLSWVICNQSTPTHPISLRSILILPTHLHLGRPIGHFPVGFPTKYCARFSFLQACYVSRPPHPAWFDHPNNIWWTVLIINLLITQSSPASCHFLPLRSK